jgi:hypothetical protein
VSVDRRYKSSEQVCFLAAQYDAEVDKALQDHSWETPERKAAGVISQAVDRRTGAKRLCSSWASGRCRDGMMTAALVLEPGPYQVLINVPWNGEDIESIVRHLSLILGQPPENVAEC